MNIKRYIGATFAFFAFIFLYEWLVHGFLLMGIYQETSRVWRDFSEMMADMPLAIGIQFLFSVWTTFIFTRMYKEGGVVNGLFFGLYLGVFAGILTASWYLWLPVPAVLGWSWLFSCIGEGLGSGFIIGAIYRSKLIKP